MAEWVYLVAMAMGRQAINAGEGKNRGKADATQALRNFPHSYVHAQGIKVLFATYHADIILQLTAIRRHILRKRCGEYGAIHS